MKTQITKFYNAQVKTNEKNGLNFMDAKKEAYKELYDEFFTELDSKFGQDVKDSAFWDAVNECDGNSQEMVTDWESEEGQKFEDLSDKEVENIFKDKWEETFSPWTENPWLLGPAKEEEKYKYFDLLLEAAGVSI